MQMLQYQCTNKHVRHVCGCRVAQPSDLFCGFGTNFSVAELAAVRKHVPSLDSIEERGYYNLGNMLILYKFLLADFLHLSQTNDFYTSS